ncbi:MAG: hypothetical protein KAR17_20735 [Cyclobacteriaceae bacterium]|nr:hypothetical protein [Cyclobacteriaceae bacterium]
MKYTFTILLLFLMASAMAQEYKNSTGLRLGKTDGVTYKRFLTENGAVEFMLGFGGYDKGMQIYTTYQWHIQIPTQFTENLYVYYGVGGHVGHIRAHDNRNYYINDSTVVSDDEKKTYYAIGVDGVIGLEYRIFTVPMTVSMEVKPYFEYYGLRYTQFRFWDFGFTVKYIF